MALFTDLSRETVRKVSIGSGIEMTSEEATRYWRGFFETYPGLKAWHDREWLELKRHGNIETRTLTGRRRTGVTRLADGLNSPV